MRRRFSVDVWTWGVLYDWRKVIDWYSLMIVVDFDGVAKKSLHHWWVPFCLGGIAATL